MIRHLKSGDYRLYSRKRDPRTGKRAHAVIQLRVENQHGTLLSPVGFQTRTTPSLLPHMSVFPSGEKATPRTEPVWFSYFCKRAPSCVRHTWTVKSADPEANIIVGQVINPDMGEELIITVIATVGTLLTASLVAYGFARLRFWGRDFWFMVLVSTMMLPAIVAMLRTCPDAARRFD